LIKNRNIEVNASNVLTWRLRSGDTLTFTYDLLNRVTRVEENGATSGAGLLASYAWAGARR